MEELKRRIEMMEREEAEMKVRLEAEVKAKEEKQKVDEKPKQKAEKVNPSLKEHEVKEQPQLSPPVPSKPQGATGIVAFPPPTM